MVSVSRPATGLVAALLANRPPRMMRGAGPDEVPLERPPGVPFGMEGGQFGWNAPRLVGPQAAPQALLPRVAFETADGALRLAEAREVNIVSRPDRLEVTCRLASGDALAEPRRIWVAVLESGGTTRSVPFAIGDVAIPEPAPPPPK